MRRDNEMFHVLLALLSALYYASGVQPASGFIAIVPTNKRHDGWTPLLSPPPPMRGVSVILAKKTTAAKADEADVIEDFPLGAIDKKASGKGKKKKASTKRKSTEPIYWHDENDPFIIATNDEIHATGGDSINDDDGGEVHEQFQSVINRNRKSIKFTIRGNPRVLIRHRTARGFMYNPSRAAQDLFRDCLLMLLPRKYHPTIIDDGSSPDDDGDEYDGKGTASSAASPPIVLFSQQEFLKVSIVFRMKRPMSHFVANRPGPGRLKPSAPGKLYSVRSDVDNLAKFVMDSLNGLVYVDDKQVVSLNAIKVMDSEGLCRGATEVEISVLEEGDL